MNRILVCSAAILLGLIAGSTARAQNEAFCKKIVDVIAQQFTEFRLYDNQPFSDGCFIQITRPDILVSIDSFNSIGKSRAQFNSDVRLFSIDLRSSNRYPISKLRNLGTWNQAVLVTPRNSSDSRVIVLRRRHIVINILSPDREVGMLVEGAFRKIGDFLLTVERPSD